MRTRDKLEALAANLWWSWNPDAQDLFRRLNPEAFRATDSNPLAALGAAAPGVLSEEDFAREVDAVYAAFGHYLHAPAS